MTHPEITRTGRTAREAVTKTQCHVDAVKAVALRYPSAAATMTMDLSVDAEAFGAEVRFDEQEVPSVVSRAVDSANAVDRLKIPGLGPLAERIAALRLIIQDITDRPIFAEYIGPFSLAGRLYGVTETMTAILDEPVAGMLPPHLCDEFSSSLVREIVGLSRTGAS